MKALNINRNNGFVIVSTKSSDAVTFKGTNTVPLYTADEFRSDIVNVTIDGLNDLGIDKGIRTFEDIKTLIINQDEEVSREFGDACTGVIENMVEKALKKKGIIEDQDLLTAYHSSEPEYEIENDYVAAYSCMEYIDCLKGPANIVLYISYELNYADFYNDDFIDKTIAYITEQIDGYAKTI